MYLSWNFNLSVSKSLSTILKIINSSIIAGTLSKLWSKWIFKVWELHSRARAANRKLLMLCILVDFNYTASRNAPNGFLNSVIASSSRRVNILINLIVPFYRLCSNAADILISGPSAKRPIAEHFLLYRAQWDTKTFSPTPLLMIHDIANYIISPKIPYIRELKVWKSCGCNFDQ